MLCLLQCEEDRGSLGDDTAMNGITVFCEPLLGVKEENEVTYGVAESFYGTWGYWRNVFYCPDNMYMVKFKVFMYTLRDYFMKVSL